MDTTKHDENGPIRAILEGLKPVARKGTARGAIVDYCHQNRIDERDAWEYLAREETDAEIREIFERSAVLFVKASDIINDGAPIPGIETDQVREVFSGLISIGDEIRHVHLGQRRPETVIHLRDQSLKPEARDGIHEVMRRLARRIMSIPWDRFGFTPTIIGASSIFAPPGRDQEIGAWIREHDHGVKLETAPLEYDSVMCSVILDEATLFDSPTPGQKIPAPESVLDSPHDQPSAPRAEVMHGISNAFEPWFDTDDETLSYIIIHHKLPPGHNRATYRGKSKADAVRFANAIGITIEQWNALFTTCDGESIKRNALQKGLYIDQDRNSGIYIPLREYELLK